MELGTVADPLFLANARFRRCDYDGCIALCDKILQANSFDQVSVCACVRQGLSGGVVQIP